MQIDKKDSAEEKIEVTYICGSCGKKPPFRYTVCTLCGKYVCHNCRIDASPETLWPTSEWYCSPCFKIKDAWKKENEKIEEKYLIKLKNILGKYIKLSVKNQKKLKETNETNI